jgi:hypothetical protein
VSVCWDDPQKISCAHNSLRTSAKAPEKVERGSSYQAEIRTVARTCAFYWCARSVTIENKPNSAGVVRRIARSDH